MNPQDDPEERIRQLEQSAASYGAVELGAEQTRGSAEPTSALPPPPTFGATAQTYDPYQPPAGTHYTPVPGKRSPTGLIFGAIAVFVAITTAVIGFVVWKVSTENLGTRPDVPGMAGGGGAFDGPGQQSVPPPVAVPSLPDEPSQTSAPPGGQLSVAGIDGNKTIACNDAAVTVSGVNNTVTLTGHCRSVTVSGMDNHVTVDTADEIGASGFDNQVIYRFGDPEITNSGFDNVVQRG